MLEKTSLFSNFEPYLAINVSHEHVTLVLIRCRTHHVITFTWIVNGNIVQIMSVAIEWSVTYSVLQYDFDIGWYAVPPNNLSFIRIPLQQNLRNLKFYVLKKSSCRISKFL